jgi:hypothetical protein
MVITTESSSVLISGFTHSRNQSSLNFIILLLHL